MKRDMFSEIWTGIVSLVPKTDDEYAAVGFPLVFLTCFHLFSLLLASHQTPRSKFETNLLEVPGPPKIP